MKTDTITALATPPGRSAIGVFRISGDNAFAIADAVLSHRKPTAAYRGFTLHRATVVDQTDTVDDVMVAVFHSPKSFTGENMVEITCHGGVVPLRNILQLLLTHGARQADPGEFTMRAFLNGKLDLAQADAINDSINAQSDQAFRIALFQQSGHLSSKLDNLRDRLLSLVAQIEAVIDFPEDVGDYDYFQGDHEIASVIREIEAMIATSGLGILYRDGLRVVIAGLPNAGKSSLMNALLRTDRAIVAPIPGTTRDTIEETVVLGGIPIRLVDTAGLRFSDDVIEQEGVRRSHQQLDLADIIVFVHDANLPYEAPSYGVDRTIIAWNKIDSVAELSSIPRGVIPISALNGTGIDRLERAIETIALSECNVTEATVDTPMITNSRHRAALMNAKDALNRARKALERREPLDFVSIEAQSALEEIGLVTGQTAPQEIINEIFHKFCIGK